MFIPPKILQISIAVWAKIIFLINSGVQALIMDYSIHTFSLRQHRNFDPSMIG